MFLIVGPAGFLLYKSQLPSKILMAIGFILWLIFLVELHFFTHLFSSLLSGHTLLNMATITFTFVGMVLVWNWLYKKNLLLARILIVETLVLICFIPYSDLSYYDYAYLMGPALKVFQTGKIASAYFQYDLLPSIPAWFVIKNGGSVYDFRIFVQAFIFLFMLAAFIVARKFFANKSLAFCLLAMLIIVRIFMGMSEITYIPQSSSIRLDWWLLLFAAAHLWGLRNFKLGICFLLLIIFINSFAIVYLFCYFIAIVLLLALKFYDNYTENVSIPASQLISDHLKPYLPNIALSFVGLVLYRLITGHIVNESLSVFKDFQIGMLPVSQDSLYWYFGAVFTFCFALLLIFRKQFKNDYWESSIMLLFLFVGCSMYFYGRSHENNIINLSGILLFVVVLCSDVLLQVFSNEGQPLRLSQKLVGLAPTGLIFLMLMISNEGMFSVNTRNYLNYIKNKHWTYPENFPTQTDLSTVAALTHNSKNVYFMTYAGRDFFFYYRGNYEVPGKFVPVDGWILKKDKIAFANDLMAKGYYVISDENDNVFNRDFVPELTYKNKEAQNGYVAFSN